jgi:ClpP class serine protease
VRLKIDKKNSTVPLKLQILESEHLDASKDQALPNGNVIRSGVEFDKTGKRVAYFIYKEHPGDSSFASLETIAGIEWFTADQKVLAYNIYSDVAIIPIHGLLTKRTELFSSFFGTTSYDEIHEATATALDDPEAKSILLDIDSPGGEVSGLFDPVDFISESKNIKPIYAIANDHAFSAAYAIASAAVNRLYGMFIAVVARNRAISSAQIRATQAALYYGADSLSLGLADEAADFRKCLSLIGAGLSPDAKISAIQGFQHMKGVNMRA